MKTPNRERQKRWKEKQVSEGKKSLSVMVAAETKALIDKERKRTGETIASIIERAITNLFRPGTEVPDVDEVSVTSNSTVTSNSMKDIIKSHPNAKGIYQAVGLLHNTGANIKTMVYTLNA
ncbi:MAG: hypothetical protein JSV50_11755 [Desulfobacteraceae bacterium]|nr:MAG: hypothetical protein JSV50_11755 [Desulfobacteraceae bacterium]